MNNQMIRLAAIEIARDPDNIVKVAGILSKLKRWVWQMFSPEKQKQIRTIDSKYSEIKSLVQNLQRDILKVESTVEEADIPGYDVALRSLLNSISQLNAKLSETKKQIVEPEKKEEKGQEEGRTVTPLPEPPPREPPPELPPEPPSGPSGPPESVDTSEETAPISEVQPKKKYQQVETIERKEKEEAHKQELVDESDDELVGTSDKATGQTRYMSTEAQLADLDEVIEVFKKDTRLDAIVPGARQFGVDRTKGTQETKFYEGDGKSEHPGLDFLIKKYYVKKMTDGGLSEEDAKSKADELVKLLRDKNVFKTILANHKFTDSFEVKQIHEARQKMHAGIVSSVGKVIIDIPESFLTNEHLGIVMWLNFIVPAKGTDKGHYSLLSLNPTYVEFEPKDERLKKIKEEKEAKKKSKQPPTVKSESKEEQEESLEKKTGTDE